MAKQEYHPVFRVLTISVLAWLNKETDVIDLAEFPSKFRLGLQQALQDQDKLGWEQAIKGFVSVEWRHLLTLGMGITRANWREWGCKTAVRAEDFQSISIIIVDGEESSVTGQQREGMKAIRQEEVAEIKRMYQQPELISATDRHYCEQPLSAILKKSPASRRLAQIHENGEGKVHKGRKKANVNNVILQGQSQLSQSRTVTGLNSHEG
ncbi:hypothetical protein MHU86_13519 [Fragilaria crotonensis]|nr:hypothetical protein MHU86_13519 [Fragilaria crotonensis]